MTNRCKKTYINDTGCRRNPRQYLELQNIWPFFNRKSSFFRANSTKFNKDLAIMLQHICQVPQDSFRADVVSVDGRSQVGRQQATDGPGLLGLVAEIREASQLRVATRQRPIPYPGDDAAGLSQQRREVLRIDHVVHHYKAIVVEGLALCWGRVGVRQRQQVGRRGCRDLQSRDGSRDGGQRRCAPELLQGAAQPPAAAAMRGHASVSPIRPDTLRGRVGDDPLHVVFGRPAPDPVVRLLALGWA